MMKKDFKNYLTQINFLIIIQSMVDCVLVLQD